MSLSSWALVMAHHRVADSVRAGYVYLIMASVGTLALLLTFGLLAGADGTYAFADIRAAHPLGGALGLHFDPYADRRRLQSRPRAAARLVAAGAPPRRRATSRR